jgi:hypothetical protein
MHMVAKHLGAKHFGAKHAATRHAGANTVDQCVRLGLAIIIIAVISLCLYYFSGRANALAPSVSSIAYRP